MMINKDIILPEAHNESICVYVYLKLWILYPVRHRPFCTVYLSSAGVEVLYNRSHLLPVYQKSIRYNYIPTLEEHYTIEDIGTLCCIYISVTLMYRSVIGYET